MSTEDRTPEPNESVVPSSPNDMPVSSDDDIGEKLAPDDDSECTIVSPAKEPASAVTATVGVDSQNVTIEETPDSSTTSQSSNKRRLPDATGSRQDRFELVENFARGGLGNIWLANDGRIRREVAFKELLPKALRSQIAVSRFIEEAQITGQLEHPGIVPIYELGFQANGTPYYVMKLVRGETYEDAIAAYHKLPADDSERHLEFTRLLRNFIDICNTLAFAHEHNVIHRDLKPHNIMLGQFGETLVLDWGLAKVVSSNADKNTASHEATTADPPDTDHATTEQQSKLATVGGDSQSSGIATDAIDTELTVDAGLSELGLQRPPGSQQPPTSPSKKSFNENTSDSGISYREVSVNERTTGTETRVGAVLGTPAYMSPEQARGEHDILDRRSDIYALGAILYRLLTNKTPFGKGSVREILKRARDCDFEAPRSHDSSIDRALEAICLRAMKKDIKDRYASALDLKSDVEAFLADEPVKAYPDPLQVRVRRWVRRYRTAVLSLSAILVTATIAPFAIEAARHSRLTDAVTARFENADAAVSRQDYSVAASLLDEAAGLLANEPKLGELASQVERKRASVASVVSKKELAEEKHRREVADAARHVAEVNFQRAERERKRANRNFIIASSQRLVAESKAVRLSHPRLSMLLSAEAVEISQHRKESIVPEALQNLHDVAATFGGNSYFGHDDQIRDSDLSRDGRWLLTGSKDRTARLWDLTALDPLKESVKLTGHEGAIDCVALPAGGRWAVTAGEDADVVVWDLAATDINDSPIVLKGHELPVTCLAVSSDGRWLATSGIDADIRLWNLSDDDIASSMQLLSGHEDTVNQLCFAPSGNQLFSGCEDGTIAVWPIASNSTPIATKAEAVSPLYESKKHSSGVLKLAVSNSGDWLVSGDSQGSVIAWDLKSNEFTRSFPMTGHRRAVSEIAFADGPASPEARPVETRLAVAGTDGNVIVWKLDVTGPEKLDEFHDHDGPVNDLVWNRDGSTLATCGDDRMVMLRRWNSLNGSEEGNSSGQKLLAHEDAVWTLSLTGNRLVSGALDGSVQLWNLNRDEPGMVPLVLRKHQRTIRGISTSPDGQYFLVLSSDRDSTWSLWHRDVEVGFAAMDADFGNTASDNSEFRATAVAWNPRSDMAAIVGSDNTLILLTVSGNESKKIAVTLPPVAINAIVFSSDGNKLAVAGDEGLILAIDVDALTKNQTLQLNLKAAGDSDFVTIAASPNGNQFASGSEDGAVIVWGSDSSWKLLPGSHRDLVSDIEFSPNGNQLASVSNDKSVRVWNRSTDGTFGDSPQVLVQHKERVRSIIFAPNGKSLLTVSDDTTAIVWTLDSDNPDGRAKFLVGHDSAIHVCEFSTDGRWAVTGSDDGTVRLWDLQSDNPSASVVIMHQFGEPVRAIDLIADSQTLLLGTRDGDLYAWPLAPSALLNGVRESAGRTLSANEIQRFNTLATRIDD
ncbi:MAG: protein kinase [Planctomycetaceae bacterium]|nr:protein kinase [Planctomycetaceae bacterium]